MAGRTRWAIVQGLIQGLLAVGKFAPRPVLEPARTVRDRATNNVASGLAIVATSETGARYTGVNSTCNDESPRMMNVGSYV